MNAILKRINEKVAQAKLDIDNRRFDVHLHGKRVKLHLIDCGGTKIFGCTSVYNKTTQRDRGLPAKYETYPREVYGVPERELIYQ